jgi:hypothetical protein
LYNKYEIFLIFFVPLRLVGKSNIIAASGYFSIGTNKRIADVFIGMEVSHATNPDKSVVSVPIRTAMDHPQPCRIPQVWNDLFGVHVSRHDQHRWTESSQGFSDMSRLIDMSQVVKVSAECYQIEVHALDWKQLFRTPMQICHGKDSHVITVPIKRVSRLFIFPGMGVIRRV